MGELCGAAELDEGAHRVRELPPRFDFFEKHESQIEEVAVSARLWSCIVMRVESAPSARIFFELGILWQL